MKKYILITIVIFSANFLNAQSIDRSVLANGGQTFIEPTAQISFTLGELAINYLTVSGGPTLSQGFHQGDAGPTSVTSLNKLSAKIQAYPNPFSGYVIISADKTIANPSFQAFDALGKKQAIEVSETTLGLAWKIEMNQAPRGIYFVTINSGNEQGQLILNHLDE